MSRDDDMPLRGLEPFVLVGIIVAIVVLLILAFAMGSYEHATRPHRRQPGETRVHARVGRRAPREGSRTLPRTAAHRSASAEGGWSGRGLTRAALQKPRTRVKL